MGLHKGQGAEESPENYPKSITRNMTPGMNKGQGPEESPESYPKSITRNMTPGMSLAIEERFKQLTKGYTPEYDYNNRDQMELAKAAKTILNDDLHYRIKGKPGFWDEYLWNKTCIKPVFDRVRIAAAWCIAELDREEQRKLNIENKK